MSAIADGLSISRGIALSEELGIGALTLGGYLREVTQTFAGNEALVLREGDSIVRWSYSELWERAVEVARALIAVGVGKGTRVGILQTNRPEFLASLFGAALAGGVPATISTFYTPGELEAVLQMSGISVLLLERSVL